MLRNEVLELMEALKLRGMQSVYDELLANGRKQRAIPERLILELLKAVAAERKLRSNRFPEHFPMFLILARTSIAKKPNCSGCASPTSDTPMPPSATKKNKGLRPIP